MIPIPCPPADLAPGRLLILACSATKRPDSGYIPAIYRYDGPLWQTLRVTDPRGSMARVAFLSAHYGFQDSAAPIADYNARLTIDLSKRMIAGGMTTRWPGRHLPAHLIRRAYRHDDEARPQSVARAWCPKQAPLE
ncbi:hypothetical protein [Sinorhizobium meliloti]|uniref:hypothetical protein n=1 Tax=Rhizobium meliloti TaxID=382 RepID=UPI001F1EAD3B|nr:hypothetical protein [Sinorhizobium meliloti]